jgi:glyoxylase-like metal-dependent hydrolase (beta-lactamase superfamily II)
VKATSTVQQAAELAGTVPPLEQVRPDVWALALAMPTGHIPYSLCYLLLDSKGGVHIVDPGWDTDDNWAALVEALRAVGREPGDLRSAIVTHLHPDHLGMAERVRRETGARVILHRAEQAVLEHGWAREPLDDQLEEWGVPSARHAEMGEVLALSDGYSEFHANDVVDDGERLDIPGFDLIAMHTPGHTSGHLSLRDDARGLLYTGDHLLPSIFSGLGLGGETETNPIADYLTALDRVAGYPDYEVLPGHGYRFTGVTDRANIVAEHHLKRSREVAAVLAEGGAPTVWELASRLTWTAGWQNLSGFFLASALAQTAMHRDYVQDGGLDL